MIYVGQTHDFRKRLMGYKNYHKQFFSLKNNPTSVIVDSFYVFGFENHVFQILEMNVELNKLSEREKYWIKKINSCSFDNSRGINRTRGGDGKVYEENAKARVYYQDFEKWDYLPFTGADFLEKSKRLKSEFNTSLNIRLRKEVPKWGAEKGWSYSRKKVVLYDKGIFVAEFDSTTTCSKYLDLSRGCVKDSLLKGSWIRGRYKVNYLTENYPLEIPFVNVKLKDNPKKIVALDKDFNFIGEYRTALIAAGELGVPDSTIREYAKKQNFKTTIGNYIFVYKDLYESMTSQMGGGEK